MDSTDELTPSKPDLNRTVFIYPEYIEAIGPLNEKNVLDYFSNSPFFDRQSSNQVLKMQTLHTGEPVENEEEELRRFIGIEFGLVHARPPSLFIIHKRQRLSPDQTYVLAAYYIVNNAVYLAQSLHSLLSSRLDSSIKSIQTSLDQVRSELTSAAPFNPRFESTFIPAQTSTAALPEPETEAPETTSSKSALPAHQSTSYLPFFALRTTLASLPSLSSSSSTAPPPPPVPSGPQGSISSATPRLYLNSPSSTTHTPGGMVPTPPPTNRSSIGADALSPVDKPKKKRKTTDGGAGGKTPAGRTPGGRTPGGKTPG